MREKNIGYYQLDPLRKKVEEKNLKWLNTRCDKVYIDKPGKREELQKCLNALGSHKGEWVDNFFLVSLNDMATGIDSLLSILQKLESKVESLISRDDDLGDWRNHYPLFKDFRTEQKRRQARRARYTAKNPGRKGRKVSPKILARIKKVEGLFMDGVNTAKIARTLGVERNTIYNDYKQLGIIPSEWMFDSEKRTMVKIEEIE